MLSRRTWARIVFLAELLVFPLRFYQWRRATGDGESAPPDRRALLAGAGFQVAYCWAYDHDAGAIRTKRRRRALLGALWGALGFRLFRRSETARRDFSMDNSVGHIGYRFWYGVVRPPAGTEDD